MRLDMDCVRDVLLALEQLTEVGENHLYRHVTTEDVCTQVPNFDEKNVYHTLYTLHQANYIEANRIDFCGGSDLLIETITWPGYELLNNLRSDQVWESVKEKIKPLGTVSINVLSQLATKIVSDFLGI